MQDHGARLIEVAGASSAASAAQAVTDTVHDLARGTPSGDWTSAAVVSRGEYGIPEGLQFGFPVTVTEGQPHVVEGLEITARQRDLLARTTEELLQEHDMALQQAEGHA